MWIYFALPQPTKIDSVFYPSVFFLSPLQGIVSSATDLNEQLIMVINTFLCFSEISVKQRFRCNLGVPIGVNNITGH